MDTTKSDKSLNRKSELFAGDSEMSRLMRTHDWSASPVGPVDGWPRSLKIAVRILLGSRYAMWLGWGRDFTFFYNDAYAHMTLGAKHPWALGKSAREVWAEIWDDIGPRAESVVRTGVATWDERLLLYLERRGFSEETYHTFSYSPVPDDEGMVGGMLCVVTEDTERVIGERRLKTLQDLATRTTEDAKSAGTACQIAARALAGNPQDLPFVLLYLFDANSKIARLAGATGLRSDSPAAPAHIDLTVSAATAVWPLRSLIETGNVEVVTDVRRRFGDSKLGAQSEMPHTAAVLPIKKSGHDRLAGFIVAGVSPRRPFDDGYRGFLDLLAGQIATAVANANVLEEEHRRAEALAELDRAKTTFFSNVSHEFRTPLTLMLGPVEEALTRKDPDERVIDQESLALVHRNGLRLQKLVNTLLDFSRIEAGRVQASFEPVEVGTLTADLASNFRSACQHAGLELVVNCQPTGEPVYLDRDMWEKIVLNLLSNAFKFTLKGKIEVDLRRKGASVELTVRDTGTGVPADQIPHLFERFHRVEGSKGRTQEGSGIGLALVQELVRLHGGEVTVESHLNKGSTFRVTLPLGSAHLSPDRIRAPRALSSSAITTNAFVEEALRWLPERNHSGESDASDSGVFLDSLLRRASDHRPRILLVDDNADMRTYVQRHLATLYAVTSVADGLAALEEAKREIPDLVLSDVMMPGLDGFGLIKELRSDPKTANVPILLLSARAGEEARVEGLGSGADDYLTKPFSVRELLASIRAHLALAKMRREASEVLQRSEQFHRLINDLTSDFTFAMRFAADKTSSTLEFVSPGFTTITGYTLEELNARGGWSTIIHPDDLVIAMKSIERILARQQDESEVRLIAKGGTEHSVRYLARPTVTADGDVTGFIGAAQEITARKKAEAELREAEGRWRSLAEALPNLVWTDLPDGQCDYLSNQWGTYTGIPEKELLGLNWLERVIHPDDRERTLACWMTAVADKGNYDLEYRIRRHDGQYRWFKTRGVPIRNEEGRIVKWFGTCTDIEDQKRIVEELRRSEDRFRQLADAMPQIVWTTGSDGQIDYSNQRWYEFSGAPVGAEYDGWRSVMHPDDGGPAAIRWEECLRTGSAFEFEVRLRDRKTGGYLWHLIRTEPVRNETGAVVRWYGTATNIDSQKRTADSSRFLSEASAELAALVDYESTLQKVANLAVPYFADWAVADVAGADAGGVMRRLAVAHQDPAKLQIVEELNRRYPTDPSAGGGPTRVFRTGKSEILSGITDEMIRRGAKDEGHYQLLSALGLRSYICVPLIVSKEILGVLTFATAESGRSYDQADLAMAQELTHRAAIAIENAKLYRELREADRRKDEFLATLAHELRNPLAPIRNSLQILKMPMIEPDMAERSREMIERQVHHLVRLVDDLLDVSRVMRGKIVLRKERVEMATIVARAVETVQPLIEAQGHDLTIDLPTDSLPLDADPVRLAQVVGNLLNNSAKYTERRGQIRLSAQREGDDVVLRLRDTGIGIAPEMLSRVFDLFVQADHAATKAHGGLGIGLTLARNLVEMHNGKVEATSPGIGKGSEFIVRLPLATPPRQSPEVPNDRALLKRSSGRRLLVVDDNLDAAHSLAMLLRLQNHEVRVVHNGPAALEIASEFRPEMIFLDIGMPGMDGYEVARHLRKQSGMENVCLAAVSGWGQVKDRQRSAEAGFDHHLVKPVEPKILDELLAGLNQPRVKRLG